MRDYPGEGQVRIAHGEEKEAFQEDNTRQVRKSEGGRAWKLGWDSLLVSFWSRVVDTGMCPNPSLGVKDSWNAAFTCFSLSAPKNLRR